MTNSLSPSLDEISKIDLFNGINKESLAGLVRSAHATRRLSGEFFFLQGDPAERMFLLVEGRVKLSQMGANGMQALIRMIKPCEIFALVAMVSTGGYLVNAQAAVESQALYWTRAELMEFVAQAPQIAMNAMRIMAEQLREIQERFRQATTERVDQRVAHTLVRLAAKSGKKIKEGTLIDLPLTRQDLAEMSGTTLYTASRLLKQWQVQGLVVSRRARVIVRSQEGLMEILEGD